MKKSIRAVAGVAAFSSLASFEVLSNRVEASSVRDGVVVENVGKVVIKSLKKRVPPKPTAKTSIASKKKAKVPVVPFTASELADMTPRNFPYTPENVARFGVSKLTSKLVSVEPGSVSADSILTVTSASPVCSDIVVFTLRGEVTWGIGRDKINPALNVGLEVNKNNPDSAKYNSEYLDLYMKVRNDNEIPSVGLTLKTFGTTAGEMLNGKEEYSDFEIGIKNLDKTETSLLNFKVGAFVCDADGIPKLK